MDAHHHHYLYHDRVEMAGIRSRSPRRPRARRSRRVPAWVWPLSTLCLAASLWLFCVWLLGAWLLGSAVALAAFGAVLWTVAEATAPEWPDDGDDFNGEEGR